MIKRSIRDILILLTVILLTAGCGTANITAFGSTGITAKEAAAPVTGAGGNVKSNTKSGSSKTSSGGGLVVKIDAGNSEARYRVREQLAKVSLPSDAIGRTKQISGSITIKPDGSIDQANSKFVVDLSTLQSDRQMRDNFIKRSVLQTGQYPEASFVPTAVSALAWPLPKSGPVSFKLTGNLTVRNVTKPVTWDVSGTIQDGPAGKATGLAKTSFKFEDFNLEQPSVPMVLSIVDNITLEVDVTLQSGG